MPEVRVLYRPHLPSVSSLGMLGLEEDPYEKETSRKRSSRAVSVEEEPHTDCF